MTENIENISTDGHPGPSEKPSKLHAGINNLQNSFFESLRINKIPVSIFLSNGVRLQGRIISFDNHVIFVDGLGDPMIFKKNIMTVLPQRLFSL